MGGVWVYGMPNYRKFGYWVDGPFWQNNPYFRLMPYQGTTPEFQLSLRGFPPGSPLPNTPLLFIPFWCPLLAFAFPTYILWRRDRRYPEGHCQGCGYDLTGNESGVCSECGTKVEQAS